jgi:uncharacterized protein YndB with AHSA1/START domain
VTTTTTALRITADPGSPLVIMEREVAAPRDLVYRCYTEPSLLAQWLGPRRLGLRVEQFDLRHGGSWRYVNTEPDGSAEYGFRGVFHGEPSPDQLIQTFEFDGAPGHVSLDTLNLVERDGRTLIRTTSAFQSVEDRDAMIAAGMEGGVREGYERLDELVARIGA